VKTAIAALIVFSVVFSARIMPAAAREAMASMTRQTNAYEIPESLNAEEQKWFRVFQEGNFLSQGWQSIAAEILAKTSPELRPVRKMALDSLGKKIGMEWCRANAVRKVDSSMLSAWGDILRTTARKEPQKLSQAIALIDQKVDAVLY
jgi:hypothetical protein